jgi:hypothetical protein
LLRELLTLDTHPTLRRKRIGLIPVTLRNAVENALVSQNPNAIPIDVTDAPGSARSDFARSMRRCV